MELRARDHKAVVALLKKLEKRGAGRRQRAVRLARWEEPTSRRHRLAITLLVMTRGGIHGSGGGGVVDQELSDAIEEVIDTLYDRQEEATEEPEDDEGEGAGQGSTGSGSTGGSGSNNPGCSSIYTRYQAAVAAKNYIQANRLLSAYHTCLRASRNRPSLLRKR
jgi:hypothetical protein